MKKAKNKQSTLKTKGLLQYDHAGLKIISWMLYISMDR